MYLPFAGLSTSLASTAKALLGNGGGDRMICVHIFEFTSLYEHERTSNKTTQDLLETKPIRRPRVNATHFPFQQRLTKIKEASRRRCTTLFPRLTNHPNSSFAWFAYESLLSLDPERSVEKGILAALRRV